VGGRREEEEEEEEKRSQGCRINESYRWVFIFLRAENCRGRFH